MSEIKSYSISLVDFIGKIDNGIAAILSLKLDDKIYEILYWFNKENVFRIVIEDRFLQEYNIPDLYTYQYLPDLVLYIDNNVLPSREEIWKEFDL